MHMRKPGYYYLIERDRKTMSIIKFAIAICLLAAVAKATPHFVQGELDYPSIPAGTILSPAIPFYDLTLTSVDGSTPVGYPVECGASGVMPSAVWYQPTIVDTNVVQIRVFNGGTSAANLPEMTFRCMLNYYDE